MCDRGLSLKRWFISEMHIDSGPFMGPLSGNKAGEENISVLAKKPARLVLHLCKLWSTLAQHKL